MAKNKQRAAKGQRSGTIQKSLYMFLPLMAVLGLIPLVMQLELIQLPAEVQPFWKENYATDFFSYYKFKFLCIAAVAITSCKG